MSAALAAPPGRCVGEATLPPMPITLTMTSPSPGRHALRQGIERVDIGKELGVHGGAPVRRREFVDRRALCRAGGIDERVDRPEPPLDFVDGGERGLRVGEIGGHPLRAGEPAQSGGDIRGVARRNRNPGAFGEERLGAGEPDAFGAARHQRDTALQLQIHQSVLISPA